MGPTPAALPPVLSPAALPHAQGSVAARSGAALPQQILSRSWPPEDMHQLFMLAVIL